MTNQNTLTLKIEGEALTSMRTDLNAIIQRTLMNMENKGSDTAEISIKVKIGLESMPVRDDSLDDGVRYIICPKLSHKVSSVLQVKDEESGSMSGRYELIRDERTGEYVLRPIHDAQMSMDDSDVVYEDCTVSDSSDNDVPAELAESPAFLLGSGDAMSRLES